MKTQLRGTFLLRLLFLVMNVPFAVGRPENDKRSSMPAVSSTPPADVCRTRRTTRFRLRNWHLGNSPLEPQESFNWLQRMGRIQRERSCPEGLEWPRQLSGAGSRGASWSLRISKHASLQSPNSPVERLFATSKDITPDSCRFEQAFSDHGGKTWEANWIAIDTRVKNDSHGTNSNKASDAFQEAW